MEIYVFDGSMEGLLTAIFESYQWRANQVKIVAAQHFEAALFGDEVAVVSDDAKAKRVWDGLQKKIGKDGQLRFYKAFLAEDAATYQQLFDYARYIFDHPGGVASNFGHPAVMAVAQMERKVSRERHRMKAFIRFEQTADGMFYATVEPDYNVLPLIAEFFKNRYADQRWIIYDLRRSYGLYYDLETVQEVVLDHAPSAQPSVQNQKDWIDEKETLYALLWQDYFKSTNIAARKNMKLHLRHVPKRYWKYLTEKRPNLQ